MSINEKQVKGKSLNMFLIPHFFLLYFLLFLSGTLNVELAKRGEENYFYEVKTHFGYWLCQCSSATFYCVSISKPIPVWFGKKFKILTTCFPNQFQFGLEKNYNFDDSFSKPIPVWFGKNDHFSETKNSKLISHFFGKT